MNHPAKVLIIVPAYNEEESLPGLLKEVLGQGYDAVVVNDASSDDTAKMAAEAGVPILSLAANLGIGGGVQTGFKYAVNNGYDIAVQIDGDGQHDPAWLEAVIDPIRRGEADCVIGSRYVPECLDTDYKTPFPRRVGMYFSTGILFLATGKRVNDTTSGFRALSRSAFEYFARAYPVDHPEAETLLMLHQRGFRILEVPVKMRGRVSGESLFTFTKASLYPLRVIIGFVGLWLKKKG
jgi:glycosyltransferase involved in cell wall biosynthesis